MHLRSKRESPGTYQVKIQISAHPGTNKFLADFYMLLCAVIGLIVGVCSIQWGKPLQNLVSWENLMALKVIRLYLNEMQYVIGSQCSF